MTPESARFASPAGLVPLLLAALTASCGGRHAAPVAGEYVGAVPDLMGRTVMVLPAQIVDGVPKPVDPEIQFALEEHGEGINWVMPDEIRRHVERTPGTDMKVDALPVGMFLRGEVERVGDPLYGYIRRLGAVTDADVAVIPIQVRYRRATEEQGSAVEIVTTVIDVITGRVYWTGVVDGDEGPADDLGTLASTANNLARHLAWSSEVRQNR